MQLCLKRLPGKLMPAKRMHRKLLIGTLLLVASSSTVAEQFWVSATGNDGNAGTQSLPWRTLQFAADQVSAGDTVNVEGGDFAGFEISRSGTPQGRIVFRAVLGQTPNIVSNAPGRLSGINIEGANYVTIDGFTVNNRDRAGIRAVLCEHVHIRNNRTDRNAVWGIFTGFCDDVVIEDNETSNSVSQHGIYTSNSGDRPVIRRNLIFGNAANGIHMNGDVSVGGDGVISGALVDSNIIYDNGVAGGSGINMDGVQNSLVRNNLIYNTHASGMSVFRIDGGAPSTGNRIFNNTIVVASDGRWAMNIQDGSSGNSLRNNILLNLHPFRGAINICPVCLDGFSSDYNVIKDRLTTNGGNSVVTLSEWQSLTGQDSNSSVASSAAVFRSPGDDDYQLTSTSPAFDAGQTLSEVGLDIEGVIRPQFSGTDVGAFERRDQGILFRDSFED